MDVLYCKLTFPRKVHFESLVRLTFDKLLGASSLSVLALIFTVFLHCGIGLSPRLNIAINAFLSAAWAGSFGFFTYYISSMLSNKCDIQHWNEDAGVIVCRIYKALFTSAMVALSVRPSIHTNERSR